MKEIQNRETERQKDKKTKRQKDRKTERQQKDRKTERQKDRNNIIYYRYLCPVSSTLFF
jgi:hypothetical protein